MVLSIASRKLICPPKVLAMFGALLSSKSAINVFAPEFKALITIFLSTGPVISTLLSNKSSGNAAQTQSESLMFFVSSEKEGNSPASKYACSIALFVSNFNRVSLNIWCNANKKCFALLVKIS